MSDVITSRYRFAEPGELPDGRTAAMQTTCPESSVVVIVARGEATRQLLDHLGSPRRSWIRLPDTPENRVHPQRVLHAGWVLVEGDSLPDSAPCVAAERQGRHEWLIREGHATVRLAAHMTWLLTRMVRNEVWIQRGASEA